MVCRIKIFLTNPNKDKSKKMIKKNKASLVNSLTFLKEK